MAINVEELILAARAQLTELPESVIFARDNLFDLIKPAISLWQTQVNNDPQRRQHFIIESNEIAIVAGVADIQNAIDSQGYRVDFIKESDISMTYAKNPNFTVRFVNSLDRLKMKGRQDNFFILAYLSGTIIRFKDAGATAINTLNTTFFLRSPVIPSDLTTISIPMMYELATVVADLAKKQYFGEKHRGVDLPVK